MQGCTQAPGLESNTLVHIFETDLTIVHGSKNKIVKFIYFGAWSRPVEAGRNVAHSFQTQLQSKLIYTIPHIYIVF